MKQEKNKTLGFLSKKRMKSLGYLPRWSILLIDVCIVFFSAMACNYLLDGIGIDSYPFGHSVFLFALFVFVHILFFRVFKTYSGIIRHTTFVDAVNLFWAELSTLITLFIINFGLEHIFDKKLFLTTRVLFYGIIAYCLLLFFRIAVKSVFENYINVSREKDLIKTVIYGSGEKAIAIANAILAETPHKFKLVGFIDNKSESIQKNNRLLNLPLLNYNRKIPVLARVMGVNSVILADDSLNYDETLKIVDDCLNYHIKVYNLPAFTDIENQKQVTASIRNIKIEDLLDRKPIILNNTKICEQIQGKTVMVSGGAGSIGSEIVWQLSKYNPKKIIILDQAETPLHQVTLEIKKDYPDNNTISLVADIRNKQLLEQIFKTHQPDVIYHAAAYKHVPLMENNPEQAIFTNVMGTKNLADLAVQYGTERFVMVSTDKAVNPSNIMGASKRVAEMYVQSLDKYLKKSSQGKTNFITTRFGNVLGSNGSVVPLFTKQIAEGGPVTITHPDIIRYFMTIPEACQLVLEAGSMGEGGEIYIFDMGKPVRIIDLAYKMIKLAGLVPDKDISIKIVGLRPGEKLYEELLKDSSKTLPTYHEKIMIGMDKTEVFEDISTLVEELIEKAREYNTQEMVKMVKHIVPEYKSLNSIFAKLDN